MRKRKIALCDSFFWQGAAPIPTIRASVRVRVALIQPWSHHWCLPSTWALKILPNKPAPRELKPHIPDVFFCLDSPDSSPEAQPKYIKGGKRYGRRSLPEFRESVEDFAEVTVIEPLGEEAHPAHIAAGQEVSREGWGGFVTSGHGCSPHPEGVWMCLEPPSKGIGRSALCLSLGWVLGWLCHLGCGCSPHPEGVGVSQCLYWLPSLPVPGISHASLAPCAVGSGEGAGADVAGAWASN